MIARDPVRASETTFDLAIVGGGVYGAMLALEASRRGLAAVLVERDDFGAHTSWNSLRIVHGGLRYLQSLDLPRFRESVRERSWFLRTFPDLARPLPCLMPLYGGLRSPTVLRPVLRLNDLLSRDRNSRLRLDRKLSNGHVAGVAETIARFPAVRRAGLKGGALWYDAVMEDSQRLIIEILHWACSAGASCLNYLEATEINVQGGSIHGLRAVDRTTGQELSLRAPVVINCAGPWCRKFAARIDHDVPDLFRPSLAFNVFIDRPPPFETAVAVTSPRLGARTYFLHPLKGGLLAGTCHTSWSGPIDNPVPDDTLLQRFLDELGEAIPDFPLCVRDIARIHAGFLPVEKEGTVRLATRPVIHDHSASGGPRRLYSVSGIKFTTARAVAEGALRRIFGSRPAVERPRPAPQTPLPETDIRRLLHSDPRHAAAYVRDVARRESVMLPEDLLLRRTDWGYPAPRETAPTPDPLPSAVAAALAPSSAPEN